MSSITTALLALAVVRVLALAVFADRWFRIRTSEHFLLTLGWLILAGGSLGALLFTSRTPVFPACAAAGVVLLAGAAAHYFSRRIHTSAILVVAAAGAALVLIASEFQPHLAGTVSVIVHAIVLTAALITMIRSRSALRRIAPGGFNWLVLTCLALALHAFIMITQTPATLGPETALAALLLSLVALLFFIRLDSELAERELLASNERFRVTFEQAAVGIVHTSPEQLILRANQKFCELFGYTRAELIDTKSIRDATYPSDRAGSDELIHLVSTGRSESESMETRYVRRDGSILWGASTVSAVRAADGGLDYLIIVVRDVTARKALAAELAAERDQLESAVDERTRTLRIAYRDLQTANDAKSDFLAKMSHELRTPLNSIIGFTDLMLREMAGPVTEEQQRQLGMVRYSGEHLLALVNDVLDIERVESGKTELSAEEFDICRLLDDVVSVIRPLADKRGLEFAFGCDVSDPCLATDAQAVRQILLNLLGNAVKFTSSGEVRLAANATEDALHITVSDTGCGIAPEDVHRIFEPFEKGGSPEAAALEPGTGLGLSIAAQLADLLGGTLSVKSEIGKGSAFTLSLPRHLPPAN